MNTNPSWEKATVEKLLFATLIEQRRKRRWGIFFKVLFFIFLFLMLKALWPSDSNLTSITKPHAGIVKIDGEISADGDNSAENIVDGLDSAFKDNNTKAVILDINSPGGSAVQAAIVYDEIMRLRKQHSNVKVYAVCSDACASAAYYIASASDDIYANPASLVGSIGVMIDGFGYNDAMNKLGIQRRLLISGDHKGFLDPFSPINPTDEQFAQTMLNDVHTQFIQAVEKGRGNRLKIAPDTFSGLVWTGKEGLANGIIDGYGTTKSVARDIIKTDNSVDYTKEDNSFSNFANKFGAMMMVKLGEELGITPSGVQARINY